MDITIRHLSGSKAGQEQTFAAGRVTLGRNPSNDVSFDPQMDSIVSGQHAELSHRNDGWMLRDLGSSNGTFINEDRVSERLVRPKEVLQLGKNGPRLQVNYELPYGVQSPAAAFSDAPAEGRTVMMMMNEGAPAAMAAAPAGYPAPAYAGPSYAPSAPVKKKGGLLKALLVVILLFGFLIVAGVVAYVFLSGSGEAAETTTQKTSTTTQTTTTTAPVIAATLTSTTGTPPSGTGTLATQTDTVSTTTSTSGGLAMTQTTSPNTGRSVADLEQQLDRSQQLIDGLRKELQERNDTLQKTIVEKDAAVRERNAALRRARAAESRAQPQSLLLPRRPKPVQIAGMLPASMLLSLAAMQADEAQMGTGSTELSKNKYLKKRISYVHEEPEIPLPDMPEDMPSSIGVLVIQGLGTTGRYISAEDGSDAAISVVVTNYKSDVKTRVNTEAVTNAVGAISGIFGGPSVDSPVDTKSISMNADMSARVKLMDPDSVELGQTYSEASSRGRKTSSDIGGLAINQIANTDTALGDVTRKVAADAVEYLLKELENVQWQGWITESDAEAKTLTINCGTRCQIEAGDVFGIYSGTDRVGSARVKRVTPDSASAQITEGDGEVSGMLVRYEGRVGESPLTRKSQQKRTLKMRTDAQAYAGPGTTFGADKKLKAGADLSFVYSVGSWAKVSDGASSFWIPLASAQITG